MASLAALSLGLLILCPQGAGDDKDDRLSKALKSSDVNSLKKKTAEWVNAQIEFQNDDSPKRARKVRKTRQSHQKAWNSKSKKTDLLKHMGDMLAVFDGVFSYPKKSTSGVFKNFSEKPRGLEQQLNYGLVAPKGYRPDKQAYRAVVLLPGQNEAGDAWADSKVYFENTWRKAPLTKDTFFFVPKLRDKDEYDKVPDLTKQLEADGELARIRSVLSPLGEVNRQYNLNRSRMILDCGKGTSGWGIRLATYFPMRFAGLILRHPVDIEKLQLDSLSGRPVLLIASEDTKAACEALKKKLDKLQDGVCEILDGTGPYPFHASQAAIDAWVMKVERPLFPPKVVLATNHDRFGKAYWINIIQMEPLDTVTDEQRPRLVAEADREKNTITIKCRSITSFFLFLNDALVDLDKEVILIVNGRETKHKFRRRLETMVDELITAYDPTHLYTVRHQVTVPKAKEEPKEAASKKADKNGGKDGKDSGKSAGEGDSKGDGK
ncbi:MAG: hypothetical protein ACYTGW_01655 [Planctomycetota bacterium]|jgi:hypothetical protein